MKMIIAFIQPFMADKVVRALHEIEGLSGATVARVRGFGRGRARGAVGSEEEIVGTTAKVRVEVMVNDELEERVVRAIEHAARTGRKGDGKVYVTALERAVRIGTGEEGAVAV